MSAIGYLRDAVVERIAEKIPVVKTCRSHEGNFDLEEMRRVYDKTPAVLVAVLGVQDMESAGGVGVANVRLGAFVLTAAPKAETRADLAVYLSEELLKLVRSERWGQKSVQRAANLRAENLYSGQIDKQAVSFWAVTWTQKVDLSEVDTALLNDFAEAHGDFGGGLPAGAPAALGNTTLETEE